MTQDGCRRKIGKLNMFRILKTAMSGQDTNSLSGRRRDEIVEFHRDAATATVSSSVATGEEVG